MIGIIIAMEEEFFDLKKYIIINDKKIIHNQQFLFFSSNNKDFVLTITKIGKTNAAMSTTLLVNEFHPEYIFNFGSAGSVSKNVNILDLILIEKSFHYDVDATTFNYKLGQLPGESLYFNSTKKLNYKIETALNDLGLKIKKGIACSGDNFITTKNIENFNLIIKNNALIVDMEIASIMQVCEHLSVPLISIKCVTDSIFSTTSKLDFEVNIKRASELLLKLFKIIG